uniref:Nucleoside diphosphate kinase n=1 Tax=Anabas testudineus TaxID=64144 RepID=A0AAQ6IGY8_ANATE
MLQRRIFGRFLRQFYSVRPETSKSLVSGFPTALLDGHRAVGQRGKSSLPHARERTLIAVKPDGVQRRLIGQIIQRFEQRGFKLVGMKMLQVSVSEMNAFTMSVCNSSVTVDVSVVKVSEDLLSQHYSELRAKPFYPSLLYYMTSGPVVVMVWEGHNVVQTSRTMVGTTNPTEAQPGTVRGDFSTHVSRNVVHASDSLEGAKREIQLWFQGQELLNWDCCDQKSISEV